MADFKKYERISIREREKERERGMMMKFKAVVEKKVRQMK